MRDLFKDAFFDSTEKLMVAVAAGLYVEHGANGPFRTQIMTAIALLLLLLPFTIFLRHERRKVDEIENEEEDQPIQYAM